MTGDNRRRTLSEVVSLEAWHKPFSKAHKKVDLHVDVAFLTGRLGGEDTSEVRFVLTLRQAEIIVMVPPGEPLKIDPASVSRDGPTVAIKVAKGHLVTKKTKAKAGVKAKLDSLAPSLGMTLAGEAGIEASDQARLSIVEAVRNMRLQHTLGPDGHRWTVSSVGDRPIEGRPWDPIKRPRLKVVDQREDREKGLSPVLKVEVRCRREDLVISGIELKEPQATSTGWFARKSRVNGDLAAQAVIRSRLAQEGLVHGSLDDRFAVITLASVTTEGD
jgi:hypothetical protein